MESAVGTDAMIYVVNVKIAGSVVDEIQLQCYSRNEEWMVLQVSPSRPDVEVVAAEEDSEAIVVD